VKKRNTNKNETIEKRYKGGIENEKKSLKFSQSFDDEVFLKRI